MISKKVSNLIIKYGLGAGLLMAIVLLLFEWSGHSQEVFLKYVNFLGLAIFLILGISQIRKLKREKTDIFIKGIKVGSWISFTAGLVLVVFNVLLYMFYPEFTFSKYFIEPNSILQLTTVSMFLFLETLVLGSLITFIILQYEKNRYLN